MISRKFIACGVLTLVAGCGENGEIKDAVRAGLNDPSSAQFKEIVVSKDGGRACAEWNAKNGFGGYGNSSVAELRKSGGKWVITEMEGSVRNCGEEGFAAVDAGEKAEVAAENQAFLRLKQLGKFPSATEEANARRGMGPCGSLLRDVALVANAVAQEKVRGHSSSNFNEVELSKKLALVNAGDCSR